MLPEWFPVRPAPPGYVDAGQRACLAHGDGHLAGVAVDIDAGGPVVVEALPADARGQCRGRHEAELPREAASRAARDVGALRGNERDPAPQPPAHLARASAVTVESADRQRTQ